MPAEAAPAKKTSTLASVGIELAQLDFFKTSLQKSGIPIEIASYDSAHPLKGKNVSAFVVRLGTGVEETLSSIRSIEEYRNTLIYAVGSGGEAMNANLTEYEVSVLLPDLSAPSVTDAVQSTYQLLLHQLRRYARIPIVTAVQIGSGESSIKAISRNISAGGVSLASLGTGAFDSLQADTVIQVSFSLPHSSRFHLSSVLVRKSDKFANFQFLGSPDQEELKVWIDRYLSK
jgi:hypothetical protein